MSHMDMRMASQLGEEVAAQTQNAILESLSELVSRGLLVVEKTEMQFVQDATNYRKLRVYQGVKLLLKDQEYIRALEEKVKTYERTLKDLMQVAQRAQL